MCVYSTTGKLTRHKSLTNRGSEVVSYLCVDVYFRSHLTFLKSNQFHLWKTSKHLLTVT